VLAGRGVGLEQLEDHLNPSLRRLLPDPSRFRDMDAAAERLAHAITRNEPVAVFGDYDVDGASSAALVVRWFRALGLEISVYVPDRITEGYGPSPAAFRRLKAEGAELVVTVDCGAAAHDALACAVEIGLPVVVIDHHLMRPGEVPQVAALVNPNRPDCASGQGHLAAAGVAFVLLAALNREARRRGLFGDRAEPELLDDRPVRRDVVDDHVHPPQSRPQRHVRPLHVQPAGRLRRARQLAEQAVTASRVRKTPLFLGRELLRLAVARRHLGEPQDVTKDLVAEALAIADRTGAALIQHEARRLELVDASYPTDDANTAARRADR